MVDAGLEPVGLWGGVALTTDKRKRPGAITILRGVLEKAQVRSRRLDGCTTNPWCSCCWPHHHDFAHHPRWHLKLLPDATVEVTTPAGRVLTGRPPPASTVISRFPGTRADEVGERDDRRTMGEVLKRTKRIAAGRVV